MHTATQPKESRAQAGGGLLQRWRDRWAESGAIWHILLDLALFAAVVAVLWWTVYAALG